MKLEKRVKYKQRRVKYEQKRVKYGQKDRIDNNNGFYIIFDISNFLYTFERFSNITFLGL